MAAAPLKDKYYLRSLHEEIALADRKLAHLENHTNFASDKERALAISKLSTQRDGLVRDARQLVELGIAYKVSELPRSLRSPEQLAALAVEPVAVEPTPAAPAHLPAFEVVAPAQHSTLSDFRLGLEQYVQKRRRTAGTGKSTSAR